MEGMKTTRKHHGKRAVRKTSCRPRRERARHAYPIDDVWRAEIRVIMHELGISQARLAAQIGVVPSALVFLFKSTTASSSAMVPAIHKALGLLPPVPPAPARAIRGV